MKSVKFDKERIVSLNEYKQGKDDKNADHLKFKTLEKDFS